MDAIYEHCSTLDASWHCNRERGPKMLSVLCTTQSREYRTLLQSAMMESDELIDLTQPDPDPATPPIRLSARRRDQATSSYQPPHQYHTQLQYNTDPAHISPEHRPWSLMHTVQYVKSVRPVVDQNSTSKQKTFNFRPAGSGTGRVRWAQTDKEEERADPQSKVISSDIWTRLPRL